MSEPFDRQTISFVVRLWREPLAHEGQAHWRAQIEHVGSGDQVYVQITPALEEFLASHFASALTMTFKPAGGAGVKPTSSP